MIALEQVLGWQSNRSRTSRQAKGGESLLNPVRYVRRSEVNCPFPAEPRTLHLAPPNPWSWPGAKCPWRMNLHDTHCPVGLCLQYAPALQYHNPTDMSRGSGQEVRVVTIVPRPNRPTWQPIQWVGQASQSSTHAVIHPSTNWAECCLTSKQKPNVLCTRATLPSVYGPSISIWLIH